MFKNRAYLSVCVHTRVYTRILMCIHTYIHTYIHTVIQTYGQAYIHAYTYVYIHTNKHINMHIHIYTYMLARFSARIALVWSRRWHIVTDWFWKSDWLIHKSALCTGIALLPQWGPKSHQCLQRRHKLTISAKNRVSKSVYDTAASERDTPLGSHWCGHACDIVYGYCSTEWDTPPGSPRCGHACDIV